MHTLMYTQTYVLVVCSEACGGQSGEELAGIALELCFKVKHSHF